MKKAHIVLIDKCVLFSGGGDGRRIFTKYSLFFLKKRNILMLFGIRVHFRYGYTDEGRLSRRPFGYHRLSSITSIKELRCFGRQERVSDGIDGAAYRVLIIREHMRVGVQRFFDIAVAEMVAYGDN